MTPTIQPPSFSQEALFELLDTLSQRLRRKRTVARIYLIGGACMALAYGRGRATADIDARIDTGHTALTDAVHEIARERNLPTSWLNEQAVSAIPRPPDRRARTLYQSAHLTVTGASAEHLLAMKLEAARRKDLDDIAFLVNHLGLTRTDDAMAIHAALLPDSERTDRARTVLAALAKENPALAAPHTSEHRGTTRTVTQRQLRLAEGEAALGPPGPVHDDPQCVHSAHQDAIPATATVAPGKVLFGLATHEGEITALYRIETGAERAFARWMRRHQHLWGTPFHDPSEGDDGLVDYVGGLIANSRALERPGR